MFIELCGVIFNRLEGMKINYLNPRGLNMKSTINIKGFFDNSDRRPRGFKFSECRRKIKTLQDEKQICIFRGDCFNISESNVVWPEILGWCCFWICCFNC